MTANSFPWGEVVSNAVWICGLAVILAALGWHDYKRRERTADGGPSPEADMSKHASDVAAGFSLREDRRNLKVAATPQDMPSPKTAAATNAEPLIKPVLLGLIMVAGGLALSVRGAFLAAAFAMACFALIFVFAKKMFRRA